VPDRPLALLLENALPLFLTWVRFFAILRGRHLGQEAVEIIPAEDPPLVQGPPHPRQGGGRYGLRPGLIGEKDERARRRVLARDMRALHRLTDEAQIPKEAGEFGIGNVLTHGRLFYRAAAPCAGRPLAVLDHSTLPVKYLPELVRERLKRPR
jgi:hypothetical protein